MDEKSDYTAVTLLDKWKFVKQTIADKRLTAGDLRCVVAIADCYNSGKGRAWPSYSYISGQTGLSRSAVARSVARLHSLAIIHKVSGGTGRANTYRPAFHAAPARINSPDSADTGVTHESSVTHDTTPVSLMTPDPSHTCDTIPLTPRSNSVGEYRGIPTVGGATRAGGALRPLGGAPRASGGDDRFEEFWSSYPKREGRTLAKQAYSRIVAAGISPDNLVAKARQYADAKADVDAKWLKMPANWLKEECWLEDPQPPSPREPKPARASKVGLERHKPARAKPKHGLDASLDRRARGAMAKALRKPRKPRLKWGAVAPKPAADVTKRLALPPKPAPVAEPLSVSAKAEIKPVMASPLGQMDRPFTPGANEAPKPAPPTATSLTAIKLTEPSKSQPRISGEAAAMSAARRRQPPSLRDIAGMLHLNAERPGTIKVETLLQDYFSVEQSSDIPADALAELLTSIELDEKSIAAIRTKLFGPELALKSVPRAAPPPVKAPWFEVGESVLHDEHGYGCVVLGSESLAGNNGKVQIQLNDGSGDGHGANLFINPAELKPRRVWHPKHGPGNILFELDDGYVSMFFDDKDGSSDIMATELSRCVVLNKEFLSNSDGKLVQHPKLGLGVIVGQEEDGKPIVVFDNRDGSTHVHPAELSPTAFAAPLPGQDRAIACVHVQVPNPFTSSSEVASELPKPVETQKRSVPVIVAEDAEKRAEREAALDAMMIKLFY